MEVHDPRRGVRHIAHWHREGRSVAVVETFSQFTGEFEVLALIVADWYLLGVVEQDVARHQDRVGEQTHAIALLATGLLLELGHAAEFTVGRDAFEQPAHLRVHRHAALHEERGDFGVDARGEQRGDAVQRLLAQRRGFDLQGE